jgi:hypothetical protein
MNARLQRADAARVGAPAQSSMLQRCACAAKAGAARECEECRKRRLGVQRYALRGQSDAAPLAPPIVHEVLRLPGQPLDAASRSFMEARLGHDFGQVRVHADSRADASARAVAAAAYTVGAHVVFARGQYAPGTAQGRGTLAHELTHVVQQGGGGSSGGGEIPIGEPSDRHEQEAERNADASAAGAGIAAGRRPAQSGASAALRRLGANPSCTTAEADGIHQAIFNARGWLNKAIPKLEESPLSARALSSLRRNFGPTYGVAANAGLIKDRLKAGRRALGTIPFSCDTPGATQPCIDNHCGWAVAGSNAATICTNPTSTLDISWQFAADCVLHEALHAAMSFMTADVYKTDVGFPGVGTEPLVNSASYVELVKDLS